MTSPTPVSSPRRGAAAPDGGSHRRDRQHLPLTRAASAPDLAAAARKAVVEYLHDASAATAEREGSQALRSVPAARSAAGPAERPAVGRAAAAGAATLERIEAVAAKVEADIASALQAHAELQAGAGAAAEAAVRAAQEAWAAAHTAVEADVRAKVSLRKVARYVTVTIALLLITLVVLGVAATSAH